MATIQILSDLHLEAPKAYDVFHIPPVAPYLALLGDIGNVKHPEFFAFLRAQLSRFKIVFLLLGNHEPYGSPWATTKAKIHNFEKTTGPDKDAKGTAGRFERVSFGLNDFYDIQGWSTELHNQEYAADLAWLNTQAASLSEKEPNRKILIFTHHSPTLLSAASNPKNSGSPIASGFASDLSKEFCWTSGQVKVWAFGHTHYNCDFVEEKSGKRVIANQRGYCFSQSEGFEEKKVIEV
ncbi:Metallo-dependent phosphatase-like protein [Amylocarpus encephaloides]|uniref:Metallo-dependent phosphatase-like protein n=1 Tax=Amylocarpus encephaloides TaxID=45428 RepID=A0A9P7YDY1_9HELO|nr:Metallo-dependent phosphatase-like protein [Amylocarpus encephaloides]